ncbi:hypothetical protein H5410_008336 [Solanum commersonii]|uniref:AT-hook motif nuclear-localized protein n=1 Tax=Solanum commersonii TaxID=4109 RepID=A0A9J6AEM5_SOLCO|nr:hypothetical protein H5410_008336 [Solanum commersonii]
MENVGSSSASAADDGTPVQPISSSTPPVPSFSAPLGTTGVPPVSPTETRKRGRSSPGMTTPSPSQPQEDGASPGMTTPPPSQVASGGLSSPTQPQADESAVSTGKKQQSVDLGSEAAALGFMQSHVIKIEAGQDILAKIMSFCESTSKAVCILSANGSISNVSLHRPDKPVTHKGLYEILSLTGFFFVLESGGQRSREGCLTVILGNAADGDVWGGNVDGLFTAATDVQVIVSSFSTEKQGQVKSDNFGTPATLASTSRSPMSVGTLFGLKLGREALLELLLGCPFKRNASLVDNTIGKAHQWKTWDHPPPPPPDDGTPVQPISSSTPPVPSFPALLGTTGSGLSSSTADVAGSGLSSSTADVATTPSTSQVAGSGLSSSTADVETTPSTSQVAGSGFSSSTADVATTPSTSQVAGSGFSSSTQPQADVATTPSPSKVAGSGFSSYTHPQADVATTPSPSKVAGSGFSSSTHPQADVATTPSPSKVAGSELSSPTADEATVSDVPVKRGRGRPPAGSKPAEFGPMQSHVIKKEAGEEKDLKVEREISTLVVKRKLVVGAGSWGTVYEGFIGGLSGLSSDLNGERDAVKVGNYFCEEKEFSTDENYIQWKTEIMLLSEIKHEGVIKLVGVCRTNLGLYLVYPFYERGDLQKSIEVLDWERALNVITKVAEALRMLHKCMVVCRGLKPADILLDQNWNPVLTDFGQMKMYGDAVSGSRTFDNENFIFSGHQDHVLHYDYYCLGILMLQLLMKEKEADFKVTVPKETRIMHLDVDSHSCNYSSELLEQALKLKKQNSHAIHLDFLKTGGCKVIVARKVTDLAFQCLDEGGVMRPTAEEVVERLNKIVNPPPAHGGSSSKSSK